MKVNQNQKGYVEKLVEFQLNIFMVGSLLRSIIKESIDNSEIVISKWFILNTMYPKSVNQVRRSLCFGYILHILKSK